MRMPFYQLNHFNSSQLQMYFIFNKLVADSHKMKKYFKSCKLTANSCQLKQCPAQPDVEGHGLPPTIITKTLHLPQTIV